MQNRNKKMHGLMSKHTREAILFINHAKCLIRARCYIYIYIYFSCFNIVFICETLNNIFFFQRIRV